MSDGRKEAGKLTGQAIRALRHHLGMLQPQFAKRMQTTVTTISRWENGRRPSPNFLEALREISRDANANELAKHFCLWRLPDNAAVSLDDLHGWADCQKTIIHAAHVLRFYLAPENEPSGLDPKVASFLQTIVGAATSTRTGIADVARQVDAS